MTALEQPGDLIPGSRILWITINSPYSFETSCKTNYKPLVPLPIIQEPFERITMDIVGPLPCSRKLHFGYQASFWLSVTTPPGSQRQFLY